MEKTEYNRKMNRIVVIFWWVLAVCVLGVYLGEYIKGNRGAGYVWLISLDYCVMLGIVTWCNHRWKGENLRLRYVSAAGFLVFYAHVMLTTTSAASFVFIIPMIGVLCIYADQRLMVGVFLGALVINIIYVCQHVQMGAVLPEEVTFYELQLGSIVVSGAFIYIATGMVKLGNEKLFELSEGMTRDCLTEAYNRYFFSNNIEKMFDVAASGEGLSMAFIDVDNFRAFNTDYGHECGDAVLRELVKRINSVLKKYHQLYLIRMGGDEFLIVNTHYSYTFFCEILERVKRQIDHFVMDYQGQEVRISISMGAANAKYHDCEDYLALYRLSDKCLYEAKENGKNQFIHCQGK